MKHKDSKAITLLKRVRHELLRLHQLEVKRAQLHSRLFPGSLPLKIDPIQKSPPKDKIAAIAADIGELDWIAEQLLAGIRQRRVLVETLISQIDNVLYRQILEMYYCTTIRTYEEAGSERKPLLGVTRLSLEDVAVRLGRSHSYIRHAHAEAVKAFEEVYQKNAPS